MQIGHKVYYNILTRDVILDTGEMQGDVKETTFIEDKEFYSQLKNYTEETVGVIQLEFGERSDEFLNAGSVIVIDGELIIYPRLSITADKIEITADGTDTATIAVTIQDTTNSHDINFSVNDGAPVTVDSVNGIATLQFDTTLSGDYIVNATSDIYGSGTIMIKGV